MLKEKLSKVLGRKDSEKGFTLVPLKVYFTRGRAKIEFGLCRGKKLYDKRETIAKKDFEREQRRDFKALNS